MDENIGSTRKLLRIQIKSNGFENAAKFGIHLLYRKLG